jgi:TonB family protein
MQAMSLLRPALVAFTLLLAQGALAQSGGAGPDLKVSLQGGAPPVYPDEALVVCASGTTKVLVSIDNVGRNRKSKLHESSGNEALDEAALKAVRAWLFRPAIVNGEPAAGEAIVPITWEDPCPNQLPMSDPMARAIPPAGWDPKVAPQGWPAYVVPASRTAHPPVYPKAAQCAAGVAKVRVDVAANGNARRVEVGESSGNAALDAAAVAAARQWAYRPGRNGDFVVGGEVLVPVEFQAPCRK